MFAFLIRKINNYCGIIIQKKKNKKEWIAKKYILPMKVNYNAFILLLLYIFII